jgi:MFS family permease
VSSSPPPRPRPSAPADHDAAPGSPPPAPGTGADTGPAPGSPPPPAQPSTTAASDAESGDSPPPPAQPRAPCGSSSGGPVTRLAGLPGFGRFWLASSVSDVGSYVSTVAIGVLVVQDLHEQAAGVGLVNAARWLPYLVLGLVIGALLERRRRRPLLVAADLGRGVLLVAVPVLALVGRLDLAALAALMVVFGALSLVGDTAFQSFLPRLAPPHLVTAANARLDQSGAVAQTSGPALGGGLVSLVGAPGAIVVDAASYLASGFLLLTLPTTEPAGQRIALREVPVDVVEGLRWVYRHPTLRPLALGTHGWFLCWAVTGAVLAPFALDTLGLGAAGFGLVVAAAGVGGLAGALAATRLGARWGAGHVVIACHAATAVSWAIAAFSPGWVALAGAQLLLGLSMGAENANSMGYRQAVTPDRLQARTNSVIRSVNRAMIVLGAPLGGLVADAVGYRVALGAAAGGFLLVAVGMAASRVRTARV